MDMCPLLLIKFDLVCSQQSQVAEVGFEFMPLWPENLCLTLEQNWLCVKSSGLSTQKESESHWSDLVLAFIDSRMALVGVGRGGPLHFHNNHGRCWGDLIACLGVVVMSGFQSPCTSRAAKVWFSPLLWLFFIVSARPQRPDTPLPCMLGMVLEECKGEWQSSIQKHWQCRTDSWRGRLVTELWLASSWGQFGLLSHSSGDQLEP